MIPRSWFIIMAATCTFALTLTTPAQAEPPAEQGTHSAQAQIAKAYEHGTDVGYVGISGAYAQPDEPLWALAAGKTARSEDGGAPLSPAHRMRIGSITKPIVATAVMRLVERGVWSLESTANSIKPGTLPGHDDVTLRHLLSHTSGIKNGIAVLLDRAGLMAPGTTVAQLAAFMRQPLTAQDSITAALSVPSNPAGSVARYSNTNYHVLGLLLEHQHRTTLREVLLQDVFGPAGMTTARYVDAAHPEHDTHEYHVQVGTSTHTWHDFSQSSPVQFNAAGAVDASPSDVVRFWQSLAQGRLVTPPTFNLMKTPTPQSLAPVPENLPLGERGVGVPYGLGVATFSFPPSVTCRAKDGTRITEVFGHDGSTVATESLSLVTEDGRYATAVSVTTSAQPVDEAALEAYAPWADAKAQLDRLQVRSMCHTFTAATPAITTPPRGAPRTWMMDVPWGSRRR